MIFRTESAASAESNKTSVLSQRTVSAAITSLIWLSAILLGKAVFALLVGVLIILSLDELTTLLRWRGFAVSRPLSLAAGGFLALLAYNLGAEGLFGGFILILIGLLIRYTFQGLRLMDTGLTVIAVGYVGVLLSYLILIYGLNNGQAGVLLVLVGTAACDIGAYFAGSIYGKTPLAPAISAKKTWEGTVAGFAFSTLLIAVAGMISWFGLSYADPFGGFIKGAILGAVIGIAAPLGDLTESRLKRELNIKDTGNAIPGHGGFLDRLDSVMYTAAIVYYIWPLLAG